MSISIETIQNLVQIFGVGVIVFIVPLYLYKPFFKFYELNTAKKEKRHLLALDVLKQELISPESKALFAERLEQDAFGNYFGLNVEKYNRNLLIKFHEKNQPVITWNEIKEARYFIDYTGKNLSIKYNRFDKLAFWYTRALEFCSFGIFVMFLIFATYLVIQPVKNPTLITICYAMSFLVLYGGYCLHQSTNADRSAKKIKSLLTKK